MKLAFKLPGKGNKDSSGSDSVTKIKKKRLVKSRSSNSSSSFERIWISLFVGIVLSITGLALFAYQQLSHQVAQVYKQQSEVIAASYSGQIAELLRGYSDSMELLVKDPGLVQLLAEGNPDAIKSKEQALEYIFPSSIRIKLLPAGITEPDSKMTPNLGYACLDLLQESEAKGKANAEVHKHGTPQQHIDLVRRVVDQNAQLTGNLLVTLSVPILKQTMGYLKVQNAYLELQQRASGNTITLASRGDQSLKQGIANIAKVAGSSWQMAYWSAGSAGVGLENEIIFAGVFVAVLVAIGVLLFLMYRKLISVLKQDQISVIQLVKDMIDGKPVNQYVARLTNCRGMIEQLRQMAGDFIVKNSRGASSQYAPPVTAAHSIGASETEPSTEPSTMSSIEPSATSAESIDTGDIEDLTFAADSLEVEELPDMPVKSNLASIFRAYDIRGIVGQTLTAEIVRDIGRSIGSEAHARGQQKVVVARDGRLSGPDLSAALIGGLQATGREVIDIGCVPTPVLYFATHYLGNGSGVMLTGSHNPPDYNGLKIMLRGETLHGDGIKALHTRIETGDLISGEGSVQNIDVIPSYVERIISDVRLERQLKIVVDCGNGVAGMLAPQLYRSLGCEVIELFCEVDGNFPNHHPDPSKPENLIALTRAVSEHNADIGFAFDGDGDRLGVVDSEGKIIWPDRQLMLMAMDVLTRQPGAQIIYDVKCSRNLGYVIKEHGGEPLMWKTGHSFIKAKMLETGAQLAGEMSGHIFFKERWLGFDDALYAGSRLLEILAPDERSSSEVFAALPDSVTTPELNVAVAEGENFQLMEQMSANAQFPGAKMITIDGVRVEFDDGWGLVRASNTTPSLVMRFEADNAEALRRIQDGFREQLLAIKPDMDIPF